MKEILIACGDVDLLRTLVADLPADTFKPIATKRGAGVVAKLSGRTLSLAIVHAQLEDDSSQQLIEDLRSLGGHVPILLLTAEAPPSTGAFDIAIQYPLPGPVLRNAIKRLTEAASSDHDMEKWRTFYKEVKARLELQHQHNYFQILGVRAGAQHHVIVKAFDALSLRYHPDRYNQFRAEKWGAALHDKCNALYKSMTEAYAVLSDRRLRARYEEALGRGELRLASEETAGADKGPRSIDEMGNSAACKKFLKLAQSAIAKGDWASALQNLGFAQSMEPQNQAIATKLSEIKQKAGV
ncbi:MAG: DnaJ domain-containing protein [Bradymonadaceae bacterium]|nr:DnaJ domain-containing protein [Lujinxingiaceae bacterium]